jgi:hypothetical protein
MDAQYWRDLFVGKVDFNYWLKKESTPFPKVIEEGDSMYYFLNLSDNPIAPDTAYLRISKDSDNIDSEPSDFRDVQDSCNFTLGTRSIRLRKGVYCEDQDSVTINYLCGDLPRHFAKIPVGFENKVTLTIATVDMIGSYEMYSEKNDEDGDFVIKVKPIKAFDIRKNPELQQEYSALLKPDVHFWGGFALAISGGAMELTTAHMNRRHFLELVSAALFLGGSSVVMKSFFDIYRISNGLQPKKFTDYSGLKRRYWGEENI